jgi:U3 small nucleolar RNA-associated protein 4
MTTGRSEAKKETIVWCLTVTSDMTVISGDSRGNLTFWDAQLGEQLDSITTHKADILSICLSSDENSLYCAGIDPLIVNFSKVSITNKRDGRKVEKWVKNIQRNIHQHDVR